MKKQKKNFTFTKKHFIAASIFFALVILLIYGFYIQNRDSKLKDANAFDPKENFPTNHYYWPNEDENQRCNSWQYIDPNGKFTATTTYKAGDTATIHLKRVTKNTQTGKEVTEYGALVTPDIAHSKEVFELIHKSGKDHFSTEAKIYKRYGTSVQQTELTIATLSSAASDQDGERFLFWSDKPKGNFKFVGIVSMSRMIPNKVDEVTSSTYVRNIAFSFGAPHLIKAKGAALYATWAYIDALLHFEIPDHKGLVTTKLVLSMNKDNTHSIKIAKKLGFKEGTDADKEYGGYSDGEDIRTINENMDIYVLTPAAWRGNY